MKIENTFYIRMTENERLVPGYYYDTDTGRYNSQTGCIIMFSVFLHKAKKLRVETSFRNLNEDRLTVLFWDQNNQYLGFQDKHLSADGIFECEVPYKNACYFGFSIIKAGYAFTASQDVNICFDILINPHYKQLKKKYSKENNQMFFRESLDGRITLFGDDYELIRNASLEDTLHLYIYREDLLYASALFNKSDCKFDHGKKSVELKLTYNDKYSKILDAYENTYDIIKLAPAVTPLTLTKRCVSQIYIQGENVISSYAGGTYWETEVDEQVDDPNLLINKYHFAKGPKYVEINLEGFNYDINALYMGLWNNAIWNANSSLGGESHGSIVFRKVYNASDHVSSSDRTRVKILSTGTGNGVKSTPVGYSCLYDTYIIEIWTGINGTGEKIYQSELLYGKDSNFILGQGTNLYPMVKVEQPASSDVPTPETFYLGAFVIEYQIWGRLLCDVDQSSEGLTTYDLPYDDFATPRRNYKKCVGLTGFDGDDSVIKIVQCQDTSDTPTSYGTNDFGKYFTAPYTIWQQYYHPLSRSAWANTSLWVELYEVSYPVGGYEKWCQKYYREYTIKDTYHIGDVIKALLAKIDPTIKHEKTAEYSSFLYGHTGGSASVLGNCDLYITQKTNILKGEYDQAAQKAEIKFKQLMDMLRDCFRCFWYIDSQNRFRIEHVSYFINGLSYNSPTIQFDLTLKKDKFNKKDILYNQQEVEYDKANLISRYEFKYMDDVTKAMGEGLYVDVNNAYIKKDKTEEINIDGFTADIDYMLFLPDDFSNDGFAILMADSNKKVPIIRQGVREEIQSNRWNTVDVQNWYASFNNLVWHYMEDLSGSNIDYNNVNSLYVGHVQRCMKHSIEFPIRGLNIDIYRLIRTDIGNGCIEEVSINIDTDMADVELRYEPN